MSASDFLKGACRRCAGHIEFPAPLAGQTVTCPHCGQPTELVPLTAPAKPAGSGRLRLGIGAACVVLACLAGAFGYWHWQKAGSVPVWPAQRLTAAPSTNANPAVATITAPVPPPRPKPPPVAITNDFAIMPFKLEKTPGSSLVYVTGTVRNLSDQQRFGVKVQFALFDTNDLPVGSATDYQSLIDPRGEWRFRALVMESKAVSAQFGSIAEEK